MNNINKFTYINVINFFCVTMAILTGFCGILKLPMYIAIFSVYSIFLLQKDEAEIIKYQISYAVISSIMVDYIFAFTAINMPLEIKYFIDFISVILVIKIMINHKYYKLLFKDSILYIILACVIINLAFLSNENYRIYDYFNGVRTYFRFVPIYIILSNKNIDFKSTYYLYYIINLLLILFSTIINIPVDSRNGILGIIGPNYIILGIMLAIGTVKYLKKEIKLLKYILLVFLNIIILVLQENKSIMLILPIGIVLLILISKGYKFRKNITIASIVICLIIGIKTMMVLFPNFSAIYHIDTMQMAVENYIYGNNNPETFQFGRFQALDYMKEVELDSSIDKLFGMGIGSALPLENWYYSGDMMSKGRYVVDYKPSLIYEKYGGNFGYHLSSYVILYLENGILGIVIILLLIIIMFKRSYIIVRNSDKTNEKIVGATGIVTIISVLFPIYYSAMFQSRLGLFMILMIMGIVTNRYKYINMNNRTNLDSKLVSKAEL